MWDAVGGDWVEAERQRVWRRHNDWVTNRLVSRWMPPGNGASLKTDLFDEALSEGLVPVMSARSGKVHGIDVAGETARAAQRRHPNMSARIADIRALPYASGLFQTVVSTSTLDHFTDTHDIHTSLSEIRRVTASGGRLLLTLDNPINPKIALRARLGDGFLQRTGLVPYMCGKTLTPREMRDAVEHAGFRVIDTAAIVHCPRIMAVALAGLIERMSAPRIEAAFLASLRPFEALEHLPTRYFSAHFSALVAEAAD